MFCSKPAPFPLCLYSVGIISEILLKIQVHMSVPNVGQFIDLLISIPAEGHCNSFAYVMSEWTKQQGEHPSTVIFVKVSWFAH